MAKRNGLPKPHATERTWYRFRMRHEMESPEDEKRYKFASKIKEALFPASVPRPTEET
jgi:hypothetical protein